MLLLCSESQHATVLFSSGDHHFFALFYWGSACYSIILGITMFLLGEGGFLLLLLFSKDLPVVAASCSSTCYNIGLVICCFPLRIMALLCSRGRHLSGVWWESFRRAIWNRREQHSPQLQRSPSSSHQPHTAGQTQWMLHFMWEKNTAHRWLALCPMHSLWQCTADAEIKVPSAESPELLDILSF